MPVAPDGSVTLDPLSMALFNADKIMASLRKFLPKKRLMVRSPLPEHPTCSHIIFWAEKARNAYHYAREVLRAENLSAYNALQLVSFVKSREKNARSDIFDRFVGPESFCPLCGKLVPDRIWNRRHLCIAEAICSDLSSR